jgi:hypothetical protein
MEGTPDPHILEPGHAPTPFTADEIRDGCPSGRTLRLRMEAVGDEPFLRVSRFLDPDDDGTTLERSRQSLDGEPMGEPESGRFSWRELQANASFPAELTTIESMTIETELGPLDCLRYTVRDDDGENSFWFAKELPGPPVRYEIVAGGTVVSTGSVVDDAT